MDSVSAQTLSMCGAADGKVSSIVSIIRDDTARWEEERALRQRVRELEGK